MSQRRAKRPSDIEAESPITKRNRSQEFTFEESTRCGKILYMQLTNFMCHSNLKFVFHPRINFIVGSNGSGKSAIMTALTLGLGARAKLTNRSNSMKQLIKCGENMAKIEIAFSNQGPEAFEPGVYGDMVIVVRTIYQSGCASYAIKSAHGHIISKKIDDLHRILTYHNIQIDNPVFMMNQDSAREFLKELEPRKNYQLYLRATQIQNILDKITECVAERKSQTERLTYFNNKIEMDETDIREMKKRLKYLKSISKLKELLKSKEQELAWKKASEVRASLQEIMLKLKELKKRYDVLLEKNCSKDELQNKINSEISEFEKELDLQTKQYNDENLLCMQLKNKGIKANERFVHMQYKVNSLKQRLESVHNQIESIHKDMDDLSEQNRCDAESQRAQNNATLSELEKDQQTINENIKYKNNELKTVIAKKMQIDEELRAKQGQRTRLLQNLRHISSNISNMKTDSKDTVAVYGEYVGAVLMQIEKYYKAGKFNEMPIGPIGRYIDVPNEKYRSIVEIQLKGLLHAFIVSCKKDRLVLEAILKNFNNYQPTIITSRFLKDVYNVQKGVVSPPRGTTLLMNEIKCREPMAMNCLIDRIQVEAILITESKDIAEQITANAENVPHNLNKVLVPQHGLEYYPEPNYRLYSIKMRPARFIQVNVQDRLQQMEAEKQSLTDDITSVEQDLRNLSTQLRTINERINESRAEIEHLEQSLREVVEKINELKNVEYPEGDEYELCKKELIIAQTKEKELSTRYEENMKELAVLEKAKKAHEAELNEKTAHIDTIGVKLNELKDCINKSKENLYNLEETHKQHRKKLYDIEVELRAVNQERKQKETELAAATDEAQQHGDWIETESTCEEISEQIDEIKVKLAQSEQVNENPDDLKAQIENRIELLQEAKLTYENLQESLEMLNECLQKRYDFVSEMKKSTSTMLQKRFKELLTLRKYNGSIKIDHDSKTLEVNVVPRDSHLKDAVNTTKALSGGERSYSTVALLLTIWSCVDHPFYFLDEYDVFTDEINRAFMTRLLIKEGESNAHRQYMFLTPQGMDLEAKDYIKIHKLAPPLRN